MIVGVYLEKGGIHPDFGKWHLILGFIQTWEGKILHITRHLRVISF